MQAQVVTRVIDSMIRLTGRGGTNVLCYGFRKVGVPMHCDVVPDVQGSSHVDSPCRTVRVPVRSALHLVLSCSVRLHNSLALVYCLFVRPAFMLACS